MKKFPYSHHQTLHFMCSFDFFLCPSFNTFPLFQKGQICKVQTNSNAVDGSSNLSFASPKVLDMTSVSCYIYFHQGPLNLRLWIKEAAVVFLLLFVFFTNVLRQTSFTEQIYTGNTSHTGGLYLLIRCLLKAVGCRGFYL